MKNTNKTTKTPTKKLKTCEYCEISPKYIKINQINNELICRTCELQLNIENLLKSLQSLFGTYSACCYRLTQHLIKKNKRKYHE